MYLYINFTVIARRRHFLKNNAFSGIKTNELIFPVPEYYLLPFDRVFERIEKTLHGTVKILGKDCKMKECK